MLRWEVLRTDRGSAEDNVDEASNVDVDMVGGTEISEALQETKNSNDTFQALIDDTVAVNFMYQFTVLQRSCTFSLHQSI